MRDLSPTEVYEYACEDADITLQLKNVLEPKLKEAGRGAALLRHRDAPDARAGRDGDERRAASTPASLQETSKIFTERMLELESRIYELAGEEFNIASPRQVGEILFGKMKIVDKPKKTKTGQYVTSEEVLQQLKHKSQSWKDPGTPWIEETARHLCRRPAQAHQSPHRAHPHVVQPDGGCHRTALEQRPQPAEHPHPRRGRQGDTQGVHSRARMPVLLGRLQPDRAARDGPSVGRREHDRSLPRGQRHPCRHRRQDL